MENVILVAEIRHFLNYMHKHTKNKEECHTSNTTGTKLNAGKYHTRAKHTEHTITVQAS
jgi:hypothetical protein